MGFTALGKTESAKEHFEKAMQIAQQLNDPERMLSVRLGQVDLSLQNHDVKPDSKTIRRLFEEVEESEYADLMPRAQRCVARIVEREGSVEEALKTYQAAVDSAENLKNQYERQQSLLAMIEFCRRHNRKEQVEYERRLAKIRPR